MKKAIAALFFILLCAALPALQARAANLPPEIIVELQRNATVCERVFSKFGLDLRHLTHTDITGDGLPDYILSSRGFLCNGTHNEFKNIRGDNYYFFIAMPGGGYLRQELDIRAYNMRIDAGMKPPYIYFTVACTRRPGTGNFGETRVRWQRDHMDVRGRDMGCGGRIDHDDGVPVRPPVPRPPINDNEETPPPQGIFGLEPLPPGVIGGVTPVQ
jgi:hypothetical protein